jgi:repressor LexA
MNAQHHPHLTGKQHQTFQFICHYISQHGYSPTEDEIALGIGITSRGVVHRYLTALAKEGLIEMLKGKRRNIVLVESAQERRDLPILGKIAAGLPIEAIVEPQFVELDRLFVGPNRFVLEVKGDSMIEDNICDGDYIICERRNVADNGAIVVALVDKQEATLKRLKRNTNNTITLLPSNPNYQPMTYGEERVEIQGVYLGLLRLTLSRR